MAALIPCEYAPLCMTTFSKRANMVRHCANTHGGVGRMFCAQCPTLMFFKTAAQQNRHDDALHDNPQLNERLEPLEPPNSPSSTADSAMITTPDRPLASRPKDAVAARNRSACAPSSATAPEHEVVQAPLSKKQKIAHSADQGCNRQLHELAPSAIGNLTRKPRFACKYAPVCTKTYAARSKMTDHCDRHHRGEGPLFCKLCPQLRTFDEKKALIRHTQTHRPRVTCEECGSCMAFTYAKSNRHRCANAATRASKVAVAVAGPPAVNVRGEVEMPQRYPRQHTRKPSDRDSGGASNRKATLAAVRRARRPVRVAGDVASSQKEPNDSSGDDCYIDSDPDRSIDDDNDDLRSSDGGDGDYDSSDDDQPATPVPLYWKFPKGTLTRSSHKAPGAVEAKAVFAGYYRWLRKSTALHRKHDMSANADQHFDKFRTVVGKLASFLRTDSSSVMKQLLNGSACASLFNSRKIDLFFYSLETSDKGVDLKKSTIYNYVVEIQNFLKWHLKVNRTARLTNAVEVVADLLESLSKQKKRERDPDEKNDIIEGLPEVPSVLAFLNGELADKMEHAARTFAKKKKPTWQLYKHFRNFVLVMLLFAIPPQRLQVYEQLTTDSISCHGETTLLKVRKHKTSAVYGPVIIAIPTEYYHIFQTYLELRSGVAARTRDSALFVDRDGMRERRLTNRLKTLMMKKFKIPVNVRDCRPMYVSHMCPKMDIGERMMLAKRMYHSYKTQTEIYFCSDSTKDAVNTLEVLKKFAPSKQNPALSSGTSCILTGSSQPFCSSDPSTSWKPQGGPDSRVPSAIGLRRRSSSI